MPRVDAPRPLEEFGRSMASPFFHRGVATHEFVLSATFSVVSRSTCKERPLPERFLSPQVDAPSCQPWRWLVAHPGPHPFLPPRSSTALFGPLFEWAPVGAPHRVASRCCLQHPLSAFPRPFAEAVFPFRCNTAVLIMSAYCSRTLQSLATGSPCWRVQPTSSASIFPSSALKLMALFSTRLEHFPMTFFCPSAVPLAVTRGRTLTWFPISL